jgi:hypothetical protein
MRVPTTPIQRRSHISAASPSSSMASPTNPMIMSPSQTPPKWMKFLAERNKLSIVEPPLVEPEDEVDRLADLMEEYSPLFENKTSIEFTPQDDGTAQYMYRDSWKVKEKKPQFPKRGEGKSGYDFEALVGND